MKEIFTVVSVICASALICTLVTTFITNGSTKKILNLVLGAFMICCLIMPIKNAIKNFNINVSEYKPADEIAATNDEAYNKEVLSQTRKNLEKTLNDLLLQNGIKIKNCKIILAQSNENSIIISSISIYINKEYAVNTDLIVRITEENFGVSPSVLTE